MKTKFFYLLFFGTIVGCGIFDVEVDRSDENCQALENTYFFTHTSPQGIKSAAKVGIWMFDKERRQGDIANWLGIPDTNGLEIYEPINVMWIDYVAATVTEARANVNTFLFECAFKPEGVPYHTKDYFGVYDSECVEQFPVDKTWTDKDWPKENNHGRVFASFQAGSNEQPVFYTTAAFSRESAWDIARNKGHNFLSFNQARDRLCMVGNWEDLGSEFDFGNIVPPGTNTLFSTKDHDGVRIFAFYPDDPPNIVGIEGTWIGSGQLRNTNCTDEDINKTFNVDFVMVLEESSGETGAFTGTLTLTLYHEGFSFTGQDAITGNFNSTNGTFQAEINGSFGETTSAGTISGSISGETLTFSYSSEDISGETCTTTGNNIVLTRQ